jgi:hypothetical protein
MERAANLMANPEKALARSVLVELELPKDWRTFRLSPALHDRLQVLLDRQDREGRLSPPERREAAALTELVDLLSLLRLRPELAAQKPNP